MVSVALIEQRALDREITASGTLRPREEAAVGAELAGYRVLRVLADVGSLVLRGQAPIVLDPSLLETQVAQQQADLAQARAKAPTDGLKPSPDETCSHHASKSG